MSQTNMSETLEDDDNMIVFLVEDEDLLKDEPQSPSPAEIKLEPLDISDSEIFGDKIYNYFATKEEKEINNEEYDAEYLAEENGEDPEQFQIEYLEEENDSNDYGDDDNQDLSDQESKKARGRKLRKKNFQYDSYVEKLCKEFPMMARNEQLLVKHLAGKMRETTPPEPPKNFCTVVKIEDGKYIYGCALCGAVRDTLPLATRHYQFKHGEMYLTCYACGVNYRNTTNLYKHEKRCRAPDAPVVLRARGRYLGRKGRGRPFTTTNRFITGRMLERKNTKDRFFCTKCPASFSHRDNLEAHENSHEGLRPYSCPHCITAYTSARALKRHLSAVHGAERYICDHCGKKFRVKPALISHLDTHRPIRKHPCPHCERRFAQKPALRHHMNKEHLNLPPEHGCPACPKRYARITHVKEHMAQAHGLVMITRSMFFQSLPTMTEMQLIHARNLFNNGVNQITKSEYTVPNNLEGTNVYVEAQVDTNINETGTQNAISRLSTVDNTEPEIKLDVTDKIETTKEVTEEIPQPKNIIYKPKINTVITAMNNKKYNYGEINKIVHHSNITLTDQKKENNQKKNSKKIVINKLNYEIEIAVQTSPQEDDPAIVVPDKDLASGREVSKNVAPMMNKPENVQQMTSDNEEATDEEPENDETVKNKVIADFLEYMRSGVVPQHMLPMLRSKRRK